MSEQGKHETSAREDQRAESVIELRRPFASLHKSRGAFPVSGIRYLPAYTWRRDAVASQPLETNGQLPGASITTINLLLGRSARANTCICTRSLGIWRTLAVTQEKLNDIKKKKNARCSFRGSWRTDATRAFYTSKIHRLSLIISRSDFTVFHRYRSVDANLLTRVLVKNLRIRACHNFARGMQLQRGCSGIILIMKFDEPCNAVRVGESRLACSTKFFQPGHSRTVAIQTIIVSHIVHRVGSR